MAAKEKNEAAAPAADQVAAEELAADAPAERDLSPFERALLEELAALRAERPAVATQAAADAEPVEEGLGQPGVLRLACGDTAEVESVAGSTDHHCVTCGYTVPVVGSFVPVA